MVNTTSDVKIPSIGLQERRAFLKLTIEERRLRLAEQAAELVNHYKGTPEATEREAWQGGDLVEYS